MRVFSFLVILLPLCVLGCDGGSGGGSKDAPAATASSDAEAAKLNSAAEIKKELEAIAVSGEVGSAFDVLRVSIEGLKETDAAKANELLAGLEKLGAASSPDQVKKLATEMASKL